MVVLDSLPISSTAASVDIKKGIVARGYADKPSSSNTIRRMIMEFHKKTTGPIKTEFQRMMVNYNDFMQ